MPGVPNEASPPPWKKAKTSDENMCADRSCSSVEEAIKKGILVEKMQFWTCTLCNITVNGISSAETHIQGTKHKKVVQKSNIIAAAGSNSPCYAAVSHGSAVVAAIQSKEVLSEVIGNQVQLRCVLCNIFCMGEVPMQQHLSSDPHAKKKRERDLGQWSTSQKEVTTCYMPSNRTPLQNNVLASSDMQDVTDAINSGLVLRETLGNQVILICRPCNRHCTGEISMNQHLKGDSHAKQIQRDSQRQKFSPASEASATAFTPKTNTTLQFDSTLPASTHPLQDVTNAIERGVVLKDTRGKFTLLTCVQCSKECTGEIPMSQHLMSDTHAKQIERNNQRLRLSPAKDASALTPKANITLSSDSAPPSTYPVQEDELDKAIDDGTVTVAEYDKNHLKCTVCNINCTGQEGMKEHLRGKNHKKRLSSPINYHSPVSRALQHSPSPPDTGTVPKNTTTIGKFAEHVEDESENYSKQIGGLYECTLCQITCNSSGQLKTHVSGTLHKKQLQKKTSFSEQPGTEMEEVRSASPLLPSEMTILLPPPLFQDSSEGQGATSQERKTEELPHSLEGNHRTSTKKGIRNGHFTEEITIYLPGESLSGMFRIET